MAFSAWSAANVTVGIHCELHIGWKERADWIYGGSHLVKSRGVCDGLFCHSVWIPRGNELFFPPPASSPFWTIYSQDFLPKWCRMPSVYAYTVLWDENAFSCIWLTLQVKEYYLNSLFRALQIMAVILTPGKPKLQTWNSCPFFFPKPFTCAYIWHSP